LPLGGPPKKFLWMFAGNEMDQFLLRLLQLGSHRFDPGTDAMIKKNIFAKKIGEKAAFLAQNKAKL
jgi:hypothetical protein